MANKAPWVKAFPKQAKALRPERSKAGGIKSRSQSEQVRMAIYRPIAEMYKRNNPWCNVCVLMWKWVDPNMRPRGRTEDIHHKLGRGGLLLFDVRHWIAVCRYCHSWIGDHPSEAIKLGLLEKQ